MSNAVATSKEGYELLKDYTDEYSRRRKRLEKTKRMFVLIHFLVVVPMAFLSMYSAVSEVGLIFFRTFFAAVYWFILAACTIAGYENADLYCKALGKDLAITNKTVRVAIQIFEEIEKQQKAKETTDGSG